MLRVRGVPESEANKNVFVHLTKSCFDAVTIFVVLYYTKTSWFQFLASFCQCRSQYKIIFEISSCEATWNVSRTSWAWFLSFSKTHRSSVFKIRIVRKKKHHLRLLPYLDIPFVIEQPNSQRSTVVVSVHPHFITCIGISMLPGPSVLQNNELIPTYNQFEFLSSPSSSPAISDFEPVYD